MDQIFNNREIASAIWILLFLVFLAILVILSSKKRAQFRDLVRSFLKWGILVPITVMIAYIALLVWGLSATGFWDVSALKLTVFWVFGSALITLFRANEVQKRESFFRKAILNNLTLIAVLEFVSNLYTFNFWIEFFLVPLVTFIVMIKAYTEVKITSFRAVDKFFGYVLALIGLVVIGFTLHMAISDIEGFITIHNLRDFLLPVVLSTLYLPFIYGWALFLAYNYLFMRINFYNKDRELARYLKKLIFLTFHIRLWRLSQWAKQTPILRINNREDAKILVTK
jgi:hypothetical protein